MQYSHGIILGLIQGLAEFLPISSSGHLILARILLGIQTDTPELKMFDILLHVGTLIPVIVLFWKDWMAMLRHPIKNRTLLLLIVASLPTLAIYALAKVLTPESINGFAVFDSGWFLGVSFLITGFLLLLTESVSRRKNRQASSEVTFPRALLMGIFQGLGLLPGVSRSGSTISGGILSGLDRKSAAKFSFMMSAPAIVGSLLMEGKDALEAGYLDQINWPVTAVGMLVACICGFIAIRFMMKLINRISLNHFAFYVCLLGIIIITLQIIGVSWVPAFEIPTV